MDFEKIIGELKNKRKVFHSEDDLKFEMALVIKELYPNYGIRLERPVKIEMALRNGDSKIVRAPIDIVVLDSENNEIPIEIKYKTKGFTISTDLEKFKLANQGATHGGRYSFRKDIFRIEQFFSKSEKRKKGYVFILTNDQGYFKNDMGSKGSLNKNFSFHDGNILESVDSGWNYENIDNKKYQLVDDNYFSNAQKKHWTHSKEYGFQLNLKNNYSIKWNDYSSLIDEKEKNIIF